MASSQSVFVSENVADENTGLDFKAKLDQHVKSDDVLPDSIVGVAVLDTTADFRSE